MSHHRILWVLQILLGLYFVAVGVMHFIVPDGLPDALGWMYELSQTEHAIAGVAEILGGLGLILPAATRILPALTVWAALGLVVVMLAAAVFHIGREEYTNVGTNLVVAALLVYVGYGRWRLEPIPAGGATGGRML